MSGALNGDEVVLPGSLGIAWTDSSMAHRYGRPRGVSAGQFEEAPVATLASSVVLGVAEKSQVLA